MSSSDAQPVAPQLPTRSAPRRFWAGVLLGVVLAWLAYITVAALPAHFDAPDTKRHRLPSAGRNNDVSVSFVTTGTARPRGLHVHHGNGLRRIDIAFRAAVIDHPEGRVLFGTGVDPGGPSGLVINPFGRITPRDLPELGDVHTVILPTPRWIHMGGLERWGELADMQVRMGNGDLWQARSGPWPRRFGMESERVRALGRRAQSIGWSRTRMLGSRQSKDLFGDGSIVLLQLRGTSHDEIAALVTVNSQKRYLLVGDTVWTRAQVEELYPRAPWSTWLWDRNRMQLANTQRNLHSLWRDAGVIVVPLLDGSLDLPEYPDRLR